LKGHTEEDQDQRDDIPCDGDPTHGIASEDCRKTHRKQQHAQEHIGKEFPDVDDPWWGRRVEHQDQGSLSALRDDRRRRKGWREHHDRDGDRIGHRAEDLNRSLADQIDGRFTGPAHQDQGARNDRDQGDCNEGFGTPQSTDELALENWIFKQGE